VDTNNGLLLDIMMIDNHGCAPLASGYDNYSSPLLMLKSKHSHIKIIFYI